MEAIKESFEDSLYSAGLFLTDFSYYVKEMIT